MCLSLLYKEKKQHTDPLHQCHTLQMSGMLAILRVKLHVQIMVSV